MAQVKTLTYSQRLALAVNSAANPMVKASFPYGFESYAKVAAARVKVTREVMQAVKACDVIEWRN